MKCMGVTGLQRKHMNRLGSVSREKRGRIGENTGVAGENLVNMKDLGVLRRYLADGYDAALGQ